MPISLFRPHIEEDVKYDLLETLESRYIGQGPKVDEFEKQFQRVLKTNPAVATGSCTDALHIAYMLAKLKPGDEAITPCLTCAATNIPLLYMGAKPVFADIDPETLNIDPKDIEHRINENTKAIVAVDFAGVPADYDEIQKVAAKYGLPVIEDAAQATGATYKGTSVGAISDMTVFSFMAIKHLATGDGGMITLPQNKVYSAKLLRWFGIDKEAKREGVWANDIEVVGYKYQMNDIAATMGLVALRHLDKQLERRQYMHDLYQKLLTETPGVTLLLQKIEQKSANWMFMVLVDNRKDLIRKLKENDIESGTVHERNDKYTIFGGRRDDLPKMDAIEPKYLTLPMHMKMTDDNIYNVCDVINSGW